MMAQLPTAPAWFKGPYEGGIARRASEVGGCRETFRLEPGPTAEAFLNNLREGPVSVFRHGSTFIGYSLAEYPARGSVCLTYLNLIVSRRGGWAASGRSGNPSEAILWALEVFQRHGVTPEPPTTNDPKRSTWERKAQWWNEREPTDFGRIRDLLRQDGHELPPEFNNEVEAWLRTHGKASPQ